MPRGLENLGNTCYINAVVQALASTSSIVELVRECEPLFAKQAEDFDSARAAFAHAFRELVQALAAGGEPLRPRKLIGLLHEVRPEFERGAQQDAHELLRTVLDALHEQLKRPLGAPELESARARRARAWKAATGVEWKDEAATELEAARKKWRERIDQGLYPPEPTAPKPPCTSAVEQLFEGQLLSSCRCLACGHESHVIENTLDLSLPLVPKRRGSSSQAGSSDGANGGADAPPPQKKPSLYSRISSNFSRPLFFARATPASLDDCTAEFFAAEELCGDEMYYCEKCKSRQNGRKTLKLLEAPPLLTVHIKRFRFGGMAKKASDHVAFPLDGLDVSAYCAEGVDGPAEYDLEAVVCHHGSSLHGGHYTAFVRADGAGGRAPWYLLDDAGVHPSSADEVQKAEAYVLFYRRRRTAAHVERVARLERGLKLAEPRADPRGEELLFGRGVVGVDRDALMREAPHDAHVEPMEVVAPAAAAGPSRAADLHGGALLLTRPWLLRFRHSAEPPPLSHADVVCAHGGVDLWRGRWRSLEAARACCVPVGEDDWRRICDEAARATAAAGGAPPRLTELRACATCEREHSGEQAKIAAEKADVQRYDSTHLRGDDDVWCLVEAQWLEEWREYCIDGTRRAPPGPVTNWKLLAPGQGQPKRGLEKARRRPPARPRRGTPVSLPPARAGARLPCGERRRVARLRRQPRRRPAAPPPRDQHLRAAGARRRGGARVLT